NAPDLNSPLSSAPSGTPYQERHCPLPAKSAIRRRTPPPRHAEGRPILALPIPVRGPRESALSGLLSRSPARERQGATPSGAAAARAWRQSRRPEKGSTPNLSGKGKSVRLTTTRNLCPRTFCPKLLA